MSFKSGVKGEGVTDGENEGDDCVMRWYEQDEVNQDSEQNEVDEMKKGVDSTGEVMHI